LQATYFKLGYQLDFAFVYGQRGLIDSAADRSDGLAALEKLQFDDVHMLEPEIQVVPLYHYINRKHRKLLSRITFVMKSLQSSGRMAEILREHGVDLTAK